MEILSGSNLILTGFMGTGKTSVGRTVAERLGRTFIDTDAWIEDQAGKSVSTIFAEEGENRFRSWEAQACRCLSEPRDLVIATGGWTLGQTQNRSTLEHGGQVLCLSAEISAILARLNNAADRPLLAGQDRESKLQALLKEREALYRSFAWQIDTTHLTVAQVAEHVLRLWVAIKNGR